MTDNSDGDRSSNRILGASRRTFLAGAAAVSAFGGAGLAFGQQGETIRLKGETSGWVGVEPADIEGETNPTLELEAGTAYSVVWENGDGLPHNFSIESEGGDDLVSSDIMSEQSAAQTVEFTASEEMAKYYCQVHPESMRGAVEGATGGGGGDGEAPTASVTFEDQTTDGSSVSVASVSMSEGGFVAIHDSRLLEGDAIGSVIGVSSYFEAGTNEDLTVELDEAPDDGETLIAMPHLDTNGNQTYDFVTSEGEADGPYTEEGGAVTDQATVSLEQQLEDGTFHASLSGENEVPPVDTDASGESDLMLNAEEASLDYEITAQQLENAVAAHIHLGPPGENGPVVVPLFEAEEPVACVAGQLVEGTATADDLTGPLEGEDLAALATEMRDGNTYVNVHTEQHPPGEIRGQVEPVDD